MKIRLNRNRVNATSPDLRIEHLSTSECLELIGRLWDRITDMDPDASVPAWHLVEVAGRRAAAEANPESLIPWEEVQARLSARER